MIIWRQARHCFRSGTATKTRWRFMICDRHAVVVVPFPFHEIAVTKRRPALVISGKEFNATNGWTIIAMITTARKT
ncbi:MAG: type II toxin-antitoxin system PemK/MazF family toxin, partial [Nitratireductor sp.]|nr:type II toxin-antitoxin system PemK/MazF family toxin [Nitratireductor sp.]